MTRPRPLRLTVLVLGASLALSGAGCAQQAQRDPAAKASSQVSSAEKACRAEWKSFGKTLDGRDEVTEPSGLASRWNSVIATVDYYATSAKASACGDQLQAQKASADALTSYAGTLQRWDMQHQLAVVKPKAEAYAARPAPKKKPRGKQAKPEPKQVRQALGTLTTAAPKATAEMEPGWQEATTAEIGDKAAVKKVTDDLSFLSTDSPSYAQCERALAVIHKAVG